MKGAVDPKSGFVVDLKQLKDVMSREVLDALDHRFLNKEVPEFLTRIPTTENLAIAIWQRLAPKLNAAQLHRVRVYETPDLFVDFYGEDSENQKTGSMKAHLTRRYMFSASHRLHSDEMSEEENRATYGKCNNPYGHGHNYMVEVTVSGPVDDQTGMVCNLVDLDGFVHEPNPGTLRPPESEPAVGVREAGSDHGKPMHCDLRYCEARIRPTLI